MIIDPHYLLFSLTQGPFRFENIKPTHRTVPCGEHRARRLLSAYTVIFRKYPPTFREGGRCMCELGRVLQYVAHE